MLTKKTLKKIILIIAAIVALIVAGIIMYVLVLRPAFFDYEEYDQDDVISIVSVMPEDGYHLAAGTEMDASYYNNRSSDEGWKKIRELSADCDGWQGFFCGEILTDVVE